MINNFTICLNHTVAELTIVDAKGDPACVFCRLEELRDALEEATEEIKEHHREYHHITPAEKLERWSRL